MKTLETIPERVLADPQCGFRVGLLLHQRGLSDVARTYVQRAVSAHPNRADYVYLLGSVLVEMEEFASAALLLGPLAAFEKAPASVDALIGRAHLGLGNYSKAAVSFERAIAKQPSDPSFQVQLAHVAFRSGRQDEGIRQLRSARERIRTSQALNEKLSELELNLAAGALSQSEPAIARMVLAEVGSHHQKTERFRLLKANLLQLENQNEEAIGYLNQASSDYPNSAQIPFAVGLSHYNLGRFREASIWFKRAAERGPHLPQASHYQGLCAAKLQDLPSAESFARRAVSLEGRSDLYRYQLGWVILQEGKQGEAEALLREIVRDSPAYVPALVELGRMLLQRDAPADAIPYLARVVTQDPRLDQPHYLLSQAYRRLGRIKQADLSLREFRRLKEFERSQMTKGQSSQGQVAVGEFKANVQ